VRLVEMILSGIRPALRPYWFAANFPRYSRMLGLKLNWPELTTQAGER